jgi:hypothetical protein
LTIYIAGKMTGVYGYNAARFRAAEIRLTQAGWRVLNPSKIGALPSYEMYWPINKAMLDGADAIYMLMGWHDSIGANKELLYAIDRKLQIVFEMEF